MRDRKYIVIEEKIVKPILTKLNPNILKWARNSSGYTLREVGRKLNFSYNTLQATENLKSENVNQKEEMSLELIDLRKKYTNFQSNLFDCNLFIKSRKKLRSVSKK